MNDGMLESESQCGLKLGNDSLLLLCLPSINLYFLFLPCNLFITSPKLSYRKPQIISQNLVNSRALVMPYTIYLSRKWKNPPGPYIYIYMTEGQTFQEINPCIWLLCKGFTKCKTNHSWRLTFETFPFVFRKCSHPVTCILRHEVLQMV